MTWTSGSQNIMVGVLLAHRSSRESLDCQRGRLGPEQSGLAGLGWHEGLEAKRRR